MSSYSNKTFVCPFYHRNEKLYMICEGGERIEFGDRKSIKDYQRRFCGTFDYTQCPIAERKIKEYEQAEKEID